MDITEFLRARLDEDEAAAKACEGPSPWKAAENEHDSSWIVTDATGEPLIYDEGTPTLSEAEHIARHDPARVLREVAAKRKLIEEVTLRSTEDVAEIYLATIAAVWSDHPDYRPEWAV